MVPVKNWSSAIGEDHAMSVLISAPELGDLLDDVTVLDVRYAMGGPPGAEQFMLGHVPHAQYVDLDKALAAEPGPRGRHPLPVPKTFGAAMRWAGVFADLPVVVYDDWQGRAAARAWWLLRHHGHADVRVLDGGWSAWVAAGGAVETGMRLPMRGDFEPGPGTMPVIEVDDVLAFAERAVLIDARNPERYRGEVEPVDPVAGHVPGAVNVPTGTNVRADGTLRSPAEIAALYAVEGATADAEIDAALYPGSWSEWVADPERPVATSGRP
jgi:thiosulfate/3-mercaptopyruvate sulfurtransferase